MRKLNGGENSVEHDLHLELGKRHANAAASTAAELQILVRRITTFQKLFGSEYISLFRGT